MGRGSWEEVATSVRSHFGGSSDRSAQRGLCALGSLEGAGCAVGGASGACKGACVGGSGGGKCAGGGGGGMGMGLGERESMQELPAGIEGMACERTSVEARVHMVPGSKVSRRLPGQAGSTAPAQRHSS